MADESQQFLETQEKSEKRQELESWLNKLLRIKITDGRTLIGSFVCTDKDMNIILGSCQEYVGQPVSGNNDCRKNKEMRLIHRLGTLNPNEVDKEDPRILGLAMIPGRHIKSIEIDMDKRYNKFGEFI